MQKIEPDAAKTRSAVFGYMGLALTFGVFLVGAFRYRPGPLIDDTAIYFRYVDHITAGHGIVYNYPGPHVYGASSLPYALLLSVVHLLGVGMESAAFIINVVSLMVACCLLFRLCAVRTELRHTGMPYLWALIPCFFALANASVVIWISQGLESGFHLLLCIIPIWFYEQKKDVLSGLGIAFAVMNKLDAVSVGAAIVLYHTAVHRKPPWRLIAAAIIGFLPWLLFTTFYFGSPLPMSLQSKLVGEFATRGHEFLRYYTKMLKVLILGIGAVAVSRTAFVRILALWFVIYVLLYDFVAKGYPFPWYFFLSDFAICFLAGTTLAILASRIVVPAAVRSNAVNEQAVDEQPVMADRAALGRRRILGGVAAILLVWVAISNLYTARNFLQGARNWSNTIEQDRVDLGLFLHKYAAPDESVYSGHGWIQYLSKLKVYDGSGINDPDLVRLIKADKRKQYLSERRPTYVVEERPPMELRDEYVLIARFTRTEQVHFPNWNLWARKDSAAMKALAGTKLPLVFPESSRNANPAKVDTPM